MAVPVGGALDTKEAPAQMAEGGGAMAEDSAPLPSAQGAPGPAAPQQDVDKVNILLVDDQPANLVALEAMLQGLGQNLIKAESGREALKWLLTHDFAVILLDVKMPDMDGFETAALIRERDKSSHTPILFLTAGDSTQTQAVRGYAVGAVDYLIKPVVPEFVRSKVAVFVELAKKTQLLRRQAQLLAESEQA
ncbi:MAG TPA: response regulator, partial [Gemmatimonadales bacterium]